MWTTKMGRLHSAWDPFTVAETHMDYTGKSTRIRGTRCRMAAYGETFAVSCGCGGLPGDEVAGSDIRGSEKGD